MLQGVDKHQLTRLDRFQAAVQTPGGINRPDATIIETYPPWTADRSHVDEVKQRPVAPDSSDITLRPSLGLGYNSGGRRHTELLTTAEAKLEERGFQVDLKYQEVGDDKPDGYVHLPDGSIAHLEAEHGSLSKPVKIFRNLQRATAQDREVFLLSNRVTPQN